MTAPAEQQTRLPYSLGQLAKDAAAVNAAYDRGTHDWSLALCSAEERLTRAAPILIAKLRELGVSDAG